MWEHVFLGVQEACEFARAMVNSRPLKLAVYLRYPRFSSIIIPITPRKYARVVIAVVLLSCSSLSLALMRLERLGIVNGRGLRPCARTLRP